MDATEAIVGRKDLLKPRLLGINVMDAKSVIAVHGAADPCAGFFDDNDYSAHLFRIDREGELHLGGSYYIDATDATPNTYSNHEDIG